ncbi:hypothetical protein [Pseudoflavonifractor phocaeensis]|uniref:hypothetical protein n=1 Tax=Pseudoflavonifractor phocaeensis TaxID=1870988 RepID=UPI0019582E1F|nr:hypothetical protein [Pseudoflavonifractor phocaeensis]MBM6925270.1 hypothetical protein [Pseudoflavonifractor phocaeensis]
MKKKLSLVLGTILALSLCLLTACGGDDPAPEGAYDNDELEMSMVFFEDGTCEVSDYYDSAECEFKMDGDELTIEMDGMEVTGTYDADEDTFTIDDNDGEFYSVGEAFYTP